MLNTRLYFVLISLFVLGACTRAPEGISTITIQAPANGTFAAIPGGRVACYGVNVKGAGITGNPSTACKPETGAFFGFVASGAPIQGQVAKGTSRMIEVYMYLQGVGENLPCASIGTFSSLRPDRLYMIGGAENLNFTKETEVVNITTTFPGEGQSLYVTNAYGASCLPASGGKSNYQISADYGTATGSGYILQGRVGRAKSAETLTGTGIILKVRE